jgi:hypothetical protein
MAPTLALSDSWIIGIAVSQMIVNVVIALALFWLKGQTDRVSTLEREIKQRADEAIDSRFATLTAKMEGMFAGLSGEVHRINVRLGSGDSDLRDLARQDQRIELQVAAKVGELREWMLTHFATQESVSGLSQQVQQVANTLAACRAGHREEYPT